jgi:hypothetical protein
MMQRPGDYFACEVTGEQNVITRDTDFVISHLARIERPHGAERDHRKTEGRVVSPSLNGDLDRSLAEGLNNHIEDDQRDRNVGDPKSGIDARVRDRRLQLG